VTPDTEPGGRGCFRHQWWRSLETAARCRLAAFMGVWCGIQAINVLMLRRVAGGRLRAAANLGGEWVKGENGREVPRPGGSDFWCCAARLSGFRGVACSTLDGPASILTIARATISGPVGSIPEWGNTTAHPRFRILPRSYMKPNQNRYLSRVSVRRPLTCVDDIPKLWREGRYERESTITCAAWENTQPP
jgi:hypothetical protein